MVCGAFREHCKAQYEFPKANSFPGRIAHSWKFNIKYRYQPTTPANLLLMSAVEIPSVSDYPAHVMLPALCLVSPAGPLEWHGQPLPNPAYILLVRRGTSK